MKKRRPIYYFAHRPEHKQVEIYNHFIDQEIAVDHRLARVLFLLWRLNYITEASCQGVMRGKRKYSKKPEDLAYIKFHDAKNITNVFSVYLCNAKIWHSIEGIFPNGTGVIRFSGAHIPRIQKVLEDWVESNNECRRQLAIDNITYSNQPHIEKLDELYKNLLTPPAVAL